MREQIERAVADIFTEYEQTPELRELQEEISANLYERVQDMIGQGIPEQMAAQKALEELGDVTEAADAVSRQKRGEWIGQAYGRPAPLDRLHAVGYPVVGALLVLGLAVSARAGASMGGATRMLGLLAPFFMLAAGGFTYLGLTQETRTHRAMGRKRGLYYALSAALLALGILVGLSALLREAPQGVWLQEHAWRQVIRTAGGPALGAALPAAVPGGAWLAFLTLTEGDRRKSWVLRMEEEQSRVYNERFGLLSGALWIAATALFILLGLLWSWRVSWVVYLFATAGQCVLQYHILGKHESR